MNWVRKRNKGSSVLPLKNIKLSKRMAFCSRGLNRTTGNFNKIPNSILEKIDWISSYNKRLKIVEDVLAEELKPNTEMNNGICRLPFDFPIISNGGNDIWIYENKTESTKTIKFWISRGFFESPQTYFIFTNDSEMKKLYEEQIKTIPEYNWKLEENWYRIMERD